MQIAKSTLSACSLDGHWHILGRCVPRKVVFPIVIVGILVGGLLSPLFDLSHIHGTPTLLLYTQHLYFDGIADAGGFYAATFCKHWYHRVPIAVGFALVTSFCLITLVG